MTAFPRLQSGDLLALDLETKDPYLKTHGPGWCYHKGGYIVGVAAAWGAPGQEQDGYWPVRHEGGDNVPEAGVRRWVRDLLRKGVRVVFHNAMYDRGWLRTWDMGEDAWSPDTWEDTQALAALQWEYRSSYRLKDLAREFGLGEKREDLLAEYAKAQGWKGDPGGHIWRMPGNVVRPYAEADARLTLQLYHQLLPFMEAEGWREAYRMEMQLHDVLLAMRARGVRVDEEAAARAEDQLRAQLAKAQAYLGNVNVNSAASIAEAATKLGLTFPYTAKGNPSFKAPWMKTQQHEFWDHLMTARVAAKADGTFVQGLLKKVVNGRVHGQFHPLRSDEGGAVTRRFSSTDPNLQNQPSKVKWLKKLIRSLFLPEEGQLWAALDYSQQEPRMAVHFAVKVGARGGRAAAERYRVDPRTDFHTMVAELAGIPRDKAKILNLAMMYGQGEASTCHALGLPTVWEEGPDGQKWERAGPEGRAFLETYHERVPFVKSLDEECRRRAKRRGYIKLLDKGRCRFQPQGSVGRAAYPYQAMNRVVQGSSAVQTKQAMIALHKEGFHVLLTVHDENGLSVGDAHEAQAAAKIMRECTPLEVPSVVDVELGQSWGEAELIDED